MRIQWTYIVLVGLVLSCTQQPKETADTIYTNGRIYTVNEDQPWAEAVAVKDGKFIKVGSNADVVALTGDKTTVNDLEGKFAMPGIVLVRANLVCCAQYLLDCRAEFDRQEYDRQRCRGS